MSLWGNICPKCDEKLDMQWHTGHCCESTGLQIGCSNCNIYVVGNYTMSGDIQADIFNKAAKIGNYIMSGDRTGKKVDKQS